MNAGDASNASGATHDNPRWGSFHRKDRQCRCVIGEAATVNGTNADVDTDSEATAQALTDDRADADAARNTTSTEVAADANPTANTSVVSSCLTCIYDLATSVCDATAKHDAAPNHCVPTPPRRVAAPAAAEAAAAPRLRRTPLPHRPTATIL